MLDSVTVQNFRCWGERVEVPLAPLTLVFGPNSAGKSSLWQALAVLKQSLLQSNGETVPLRCDGLQASLGDFTNLVYQHDTAREISIGVSFKPAVPRGPFGIGADVRRIFAKFGHNKSLPSAGELKELTFEFARRENGTAVSTSFKFEPGEGWRLTDLPDELGEYLRKLVHPLVGAPKSSTQSEDVVSAFLTEFTSACTFRVVAGIPRPQIAARESAVPETRRPLEETQGDEHFEPERLAGFDTARMLVFDAWLRNMEAFAVELGEVLGNVRHIGPIREPLPRVQLLGGLDPNQTDVGYAGEQVLSVLHREPVKRHVRRALTLLKEAASFDYEIDATPIDLGEGEAGRAIWLKLTDGANKASVTAADVGSGVAQMLPIIVQVCAATGLTCIVEQPELHLHPRLQVAMMQVLAERSGCAEPGGGVQLILETHSEAMIERIRRLVRQKLLDRVSRVSILYVRPGGGGSEVMFFGLKENGDWMENTWPGDWGYFGEGWDELTAKDLPFTVPELREAPDDPVRNPARLRR